MPNENRHNEEQGSEDSAKPDLTFVTNLELIAELKKRHQGIVIALESDAKHDSESVTIYTDWYGGISRCLGMCLQLKMHILQTSREKSRPTPPGDG